MAYRHVNFPAAKNEGGIEFLRLSLAAASPDESRLGELVYHIPAMKRALSPFLLAHLGVACEMGAENIGMQVCILGYSAE